MTAKSNSFFSYQGDNNATLSLLNIVLRCRRALHGVDRRPTQRRGWQVLKHILCNYRRRWPCMRLIPTDNSHRSLSTVSPACRRVLWFFVQSLRLRGTGVLHPGLQLVARHSHRRQNDPLASGTALIPVSTSNRPGGITSQLPAGGTSFNFGLEDPTKIGGLNSDFTQPGSQNYIPGLDNGAESHLLSGNRISLAATTCPAARRAVCSQPRSASKATRPPTSRRCISTTPPTPKGPIARTRPCATAFASSPRRTM